MSLQNESEELGIVARFWIWYETTATPEEQAHYQSYDTAIDFGRSHPPSSSSPDFSAWDITLVASGYTATPVGIPDDLAAKPLTGAAAGDLLGRVAAYERAAAAWNEAENGGLSSIEE